MFGTLAAIPICMKNTNIDKAFELVERDHGGCDENCCDIGLALKYGYDAIAIVQWSGCGASDAEFDKFYSKLPKSYTEIEYKKQINEFLAQMHTSVCSSCNAYCRNEFEKPNFCDCCAKSIKVG